MYVRKIIAFLEIILMLSNHNLMFFWEEVAGLRMSVGREKAVGGSNNWRGDTSSFLVVSK